MNEIILKVNEIISPVYLVGGSVRDILMGAEPNDYDFSTPLDPDRIESRIRESGRRPYLTGKRFGTVGVKLSGYLIEITTFRKESYHSGSRKPEVQFVDDLTADLSRRDFTINAVALKDRRVIDPFNGRKDIENKVIRCVGNPATRFREDPLRMLRATRFAAQLGFTIEPETEKCIYSNSFSILEVSKERWVYEIDRLLLSSHVDAGLRYLMDTGLLSYLLPELSVQKNFNQRSRHHDFDLWEHTVRTVHETPSEINLRWAALLHDIAKPYVRRDKADRSTYAHHASLGYEMVMRLGPYLKWSTLRTKEVSELVRSHMKEDNPLRKSDNSSKKSHGDS